MHLQRLVHLRDHHPLHRGPQQIRLHQSARKHHRRGGHAELLPRLPVDQAEEGERYPRVLLHHPHNAAVQVDPALGRLEDSDTDVQSVGSRVQPAHLLPDTGHRGVRVVDLLRREDTVQPAQRFHVDTGRPVVGHHHHDDGWLRRHGAKDIRWLVRGGRQSVDRGVYVATRRTEW